MKGDMKMDKNIIKYFVTFKDRNGHKHYTIASWLRTTGTVSYPLDMVFAK